MRKLVALTLFSISLIMGSCANSHNAQNKTASTSNHNETETPIKTPPKNSAVTGLLGKTTINFYGSSDNGIWNVAIRFGGKITFISAPNSIAFESDTNHVIVANGADVLHVFSENKTYKLEVVIETATCKEDGKIVSVQIENKKTKEKKSFSGCGKYMGDPRLQTVWYLEKINDTKLTASEFPGERPHFEFDLINKDISGFAGCNQVHGDVQFTYQQMHIKPLISTRMYCKNTSKIETQVLKILGDNPHYYFKNDQLIIETENGLLTLKEVNHD